jgi:L-fucose isomerase
MPLAKPRIGVLTFSDGREYAHRPQIEENLAFQNRLAGRLRDAGCEVVTGDLVWSNQIARDEGRKLAQAGVEMTILNYAVWAFPQFTVMATRFAPGPYCLLGNVNPARPGMVAVLAAAGALDQVGTDYARIFGDTADDVTMARLMTWVRAAHATQAIRGETYGLFGGRSIGINTAVSNTDEWAALFGVDVHHVDQWEIVRRAAEVDAKRVRAGREWLEKYCRKVHYDGKQLTPALLDRQIAAYHVLRDICAEQGFDFLGVKAQPELTERFATMDVPEAFLNDPYDWEGAHEPIVCATEADMDAALTMELFKHLNGTPVLFADVRHYVAEHGVFDLVNSGQHATWFAARSENPAENLRLVELHPEGFYFPAGGASVFHIAAAGEFTFARLTRSGLGYRMHIVPGELVRLGEREEARIVSEVQPNWPHAFARFECDADTFLHSFSCNHIHGVYGDVTGELATACDLWGIEPIVLE